MTIRTSLVTLATATALMSLSATTLADSPREWGYWDAATAAGPGTGGNDGFSKMTYSQNINNANNNNNGGQLNNEQNTTRLGRDVFTPDVNESVSNYVAYNICFYKCNKRRKVQNKAGKMFVNITKGDNPENTTVNIAGTYQGKKFTSTGGSKSIVEYTHTDIYGTYKQTSLNAHTSKHWFWIPLEATYNDVPQSAYFWGYMGTRKSVGTVFSGKPVSATEIAKQFRIGQTYNFVGRSYLGSTVNINVNFQKANWNGSWSKVKNMHNGFKAAGNITGNTLTSSKVKGFGKKRAVGYVKKGIVDATLVGAIKGTDASKAAVIGKTVLTVKKRRGTRKVADIFAAQGVAKAPKIVKPAVVR